jgi:hypothetical protein
VGVRSHPEQRSLTCAAGESIALGSISFSHAKWIAAWYEKRSFSSEAAIR